MAPIYLGLVDIRPLTVAFEVETGSYCASEHRTFAKSQTGYQYRFRNNYLGFLCDEQKATLLAYQS